MTSMLRDDAKKYSGIIVEKIVGLGEWPVCWTCGGSLK